jgi:hypothetical protein
MLEHAVLVLRFATVLGGAFVKAQYYLSSSPVRKMVSIRIVMVSSMKMRMQMVMVGTAVMVIAAIR